MRQTLAATKNRTAWYGFFYAVETGKLRSAAPLSPIDADISSFATLFRHFSKICMTTAGTAMYPLGNMAG